MDLNNSKAAFIGIDVSCAKRKRIPILFAVKEKHRLVPLSVMTLPFKPPLGPGNAGVINDHQCAAYAELVHDYIVNVCSALNLKPICIALDAPLTPRSREVENRVAEQQLNRAGISCYKTPSSDEFAMIKGKAQAHLNHGRKLSNIPHSMQLWMLAGFEIAKQLKDLCSIIEVYPQATIRRLLPSVAHKTKQGVAAQQLNALAAFTGWPEDNEVADINLISAGDFHDRVDAYSAAWVASLPDEDRDVFGIAGTDDVINVPAQHLIKSVLPELKNRSPSLMFERNIKTAVQTDFSRECPACQKHLFKRWPWGWDSHAAYKCIAAVGVTAEDRKQWFRKNFLQK